MCSGAVPRKNFRVLYGGDDHDVWWFGDVYDMMSVPVEHLKASLECEVVPATKPGRSPSCISVEVKSSRDEGRNIKIRWALFGAR